MYKVYDDEVQYILLNTLAINFSNSNFVYLTD